MTKEFQSLSNHSCLKSVDELVTQSLTKRFFTFGG